MPWRRGRDVRDAVIGGSLDPGLLVEETVLCVLERMPELRLDPVAEPPVFSVRGNDARWSPLHVAYRSDGHTAA